MESYKAVNFANFLQHLDTRLHAMDQIPSTTHTNRVLTKCAFAESITLHNVTNVLRGQEIGDLCSFYNISVMDLAGKIHEEIQTGGYSLYDLYDIAGQISYSAIPSEGKIIRAPKAPGDLMCTASMTYSQLYV